LGYRLADGPAPEKPLTAGDHVGVHKQVDGRYYIGVSLIAGRASGTLLGQIVDLAEKFGSTRLRTTPHQKILLLDIEESDVDAVTKLEERLDGLDLPHPISLHLNGCPNSCARIQTADIGLKGQIITDDEGQQVPGFQVHVGGGLASKDRDEAGLGRTVRG